MSSATSSWQDLPIELISESLTYLNLSELYLVSLTSRRLSEITRPFIFRDISIWHDSHSTLWRILGAIARNRSIGPMVQQLNLWAYKNYREYERPPSELKAWVSRKLSAREEHRALSGYNQGQRNDWALLKQLGEEYGVSGSMLVHGGVYALSLLLLYCTSNLKLFKLGFSCPWGFLLATAARGDLPGGIPVGLQTIEVLEIMRHRETFGSVGESDPCRCASHVLPLLRLPRLRSVELAGVKPWDPTSLFHVAAAPSITNLRFGKHCDSRIIASLIKSCIRVTSISLVDDVFIHWDTKEWEEARDALELRSGYLEYLEISHASGIDDILGKMQSGDRAPWSFTSFTALRHLNVTFPVITAQPGDKIGIHTILPPNIETVVIETQTMDWSLEAFLHSTDIVERWADKRKGFPRLESFELVGLGTAFRHSDVTVENLEQARRDLEAVGVRLRSYSFVVYADGRTYSDYEDPDLSLLYPL